MRTLACCVVTVVIVIWTAACGGPASNSALTPEVGTPDTPFRLGQFEHDGRRGVVMEVGGRRYDLGAQAGSGSLPDNLLDLIGDYPALSGQLYGMANRLSQGGAAGQETLCNPRRR